MNIAIIVRRLDRIGGVERQALCLAKGLRERGHTVTLYTFFYNPEALFGGLRDVAPVVSLGARQGALERFLLAVPLVSFFVMAYVDRRRSHALALRIDRSTEVLNPHDQVVYQVAHYYKTLVRDIPSVWTMDDLPTRAFTRYRDAACSGRSVGLLHRVVDRALDAVAVLPFIPAQTAVAVLDERDKAWVREQFGKDAVVVRPGADTAGFAYRARTAAGRPLRMLMAGIYFPHRRFEDGIRALALLRERGIEATLTIVGRSHAADPYVLRVRALITQLGLESQVTLRGEVTEEELHALHSAADAFVFASHLQSWGIAVFEAMASGTPVVVSRSAGASEVLTHGQTALLVKPLSPVQIADAAEALAGDPALYGRLSAQGRAFVEGNLRWDTMVTQMEALLRSASATYGH